MMKENALESMIFESLFQHLDFIYMDKYAVEADEVAYQIHTLLHAILGIAVPRSEILWGHEADQTFLVAARYRRKRISRSILLEAFRTSSPEAFRATIQSWKSAGQDIDFTHVEGAKARAAAARRADNARAGARGMNEVVEQGCSNPSCQSGMTKFLKLSQCERCKSVHYCSRDCQKAHWKTEHKLVCRPISS